MIVTGLQEVIIVIVTAVVSISKAELTDDNEKPGAYVLNELIIGLNAEVSKTQNNKNLIFLRELDSNLLETIKIMDAYILFTMDRNGFQILRSHYCAHPSSPRSMGIIIDYCRVSD